MADLEQQVRGLSTLLSLQAQVQRAATLMEARYHVVNDTSLILPYRQALLCDPGTGRVTAVSDLPAPDPRAPLLLWVRRLAAHLETAQPEGGLIDPASLPDSLREEWADWFPAHVLHLPLHHPRFENQGALLLTRDTPFRDEESTLAKHLAEIYAYTLGSFASHGLPWKSRVGRLLRKRTFLLLMAAFLLAVLLLIRVPLTSVGDCEVVARAPAVLRSPLNGVIDEVLVRPNQTVHKGQPLLRLDDRDLLSRLLVTRKALETAQAEYRQVSQSALSDPDSKWRLTLTRAAVAERREQLRHIEELLQRTEIPAPQDGMAIFTDPDELVGLPVQVGQRLMEISAEHDSAARIWLPVEEAGELRSDTPVTVFLNIAPEEPVPATLHYAAFTAETSPLGVLSYRVRARFEDETQRPRIGMRGLALVRGERVSLLYYLLRRPYAAVRRWLGV